MRQALIVASLLAIMTVPSSGALSDGDCSGVGYDSGLRVGDEVGYGFDVGACATTVTMPGTCSGVAASSGAYLDASLVGFGTVACAGRHTTAESTHAAVDPCDPNFQGGGYAWRHQTQGVSLPYLVSAGYVVGCMYQGSGSGSTASWVSLRSESWSGGVAEWYDFTYAFRSPSGSQTYHGRGIAAAGAGWFDGQDPSGTYCYVGLDTPCPVALGAPPAPPAPPPMLP